MKRRAVLTLCVLTLVFAGCSSKSADTHGEADHVDNTAVGPGRPSSTATISIVQPVAAGPLASGKVPVKLGLDGGKVLSAATKDLKPNEGHIHLSLDGKLQEMIYQLDTELQVPPGKHTIEAEFVAGDHAPFNPRVIARRELDIS